MSQTDRRPGFVEFIFQWRETDNNVKKEIKRKLISDSEK